MTEFGIDKVRFLKNANGNYEIWFIGNDFDICLFFKEDYVGVFNPKASVLKKVNLSQHSVSQNAQNAEWLASRFNFGVDKITFWHNANGNFEIQFKTSKDNITLFFSRDMIGVYDANTITSKTVRLSQHSVSQISKNPKIYVGTKVVNSWGTAGQLKVFSLTEFSTLFGGEFGTHTYDCVLVMNGDGNANGVYLSAAGYWSGDGIWVKTLNGSGSNSIRINYVVVRLQHSVSQEKIGDYQVNVAGSVFSMNVVYIPNQNAIRVICDRVSGWMIASGNGYKSASISLPSKYTPKTNLYAIGHADFSAQFSVYIELKTDGKLYLTASYYGGMNSYGVNKISVMLYL